MRDRIYNEAILDTLPQVIPSGGSAEGNVVEIQNIVAKDGGRIGNMSLFIKTSGAGSLKAEAYTTGDLDQADSEYTDSPVPVVTTIVAGVSQHSFSLPLCSRFKIVLTETSGTADVTVEKARVLTR